MRQLGDSDLNMTPTLGTSLSLSSENMIQLAEDQTTVCPPSTPAMMASLTARDTVDGAASGFSNSSARGLSLADHGRTDLLLCNTLSQGPRRLPNHETFEFQTPPCSMTVPECSGFSKNPIRSDLIPFAQGDPSVYCTVVPESSGFSNNPVRPDLISVARTDPSLSLYNTVIPESSGFSNNPIRPDLIPFPQTDLSSYDFAPGASSFSNNLACGINFIASDQQRPSPFDTAAPEGLSLVNYKSYDGHKHSSLDHALTQDIIHSNGNFQLP